MNKLKISLLLILTLLLTNCANQEKQQAQSILEQANTLMTNQQYSHAKLKIDSLRNSFPKQLKIIKQGVLLLRDIEMAEQSRNVAYCDSMIQQKVKQAEPLTLLFNLEHNKAYQTTPYYLHKKLQWSNAERTQLLAKVDQKGALILESHYCGSSPIKHISVAVGGTQTQSIAPNGSTNYSYSAGGKYYETVQFSQSQQNGILEYLTNHQNEKIQIALKSDKKTTPISLSKVEITALSQVLQLATTLQEISDLQKEYAIAQARVNYLQQKNADTKERELKNQKQ